MRCFLRQRASGCCEPHKIPAKKCAITARLTLPVSAARYTGGTAEQEVSTMTITCNLYINGQWHDAEGRRTFTRRRPAH
ncbi:TPA: hypothetical protein ACXEWY_004151, partial [Klebsiella pneumoniae]